jgi:hypothetical protein
MTCRVSLVVAWLATVPTLGATRQVVFRASADAVSVDVSVSRGNRPVPDLTTSDFELLDNGIPQTIQALSSETLPIDVTLLLDVSGSVEGRLLERMKAGVIETAELLGHEDRLRLIAVQHRLHEIFPFQPGGTRPPVDALAAVGGTSLLDGLVAAMARTAQPDRRQLVVAYTDGQDTSSVLDGATALAVALRSDAVVYIVVPTDDGSKPAGRTLLADLAERTGGQLFVTGSADPVTDAFRRAIGDFHASYVLRYTPTGVSRDGWHELTVHVTSGSYEVRARKGYGGG